MALKPWEGMEETEPFACGLFRVKRRLLRSPRTGAVHPFFVLSTRDWVNVVALTPERRLVMVRQFRAGPGEVTLEIPGGAVEPEDPSPEAAARRELAEETGYVSERWTRLGCVQPNPAILDNVCHVFLAEGCVRTLEPQPDLAEELEVEEVLPAEAAGRVAGGEIRHALVVAAFHLLDLHRRTVS